MDNYIGVVILAAGKGTRMGSDLPKVLLEIGGKPIVAYTIDTLERMGFSNKQIVLVVGHKHEMVRKYFADQVTYAYQEEQKGTAHAAYVGMNALPEEVDQVLVMGGDDSAFYTAETLGSFITTHVVSAASLSLLTASVEDPSALGRVVRHDDGSVDIVEKENLTEEQKTITEISTGTFCFNRRWFQDLFPSMPMIENLGEYGLPTTVTMAKKHGDVYQVVRMKESDQWFGINTPEQLAEADKRKQYE